MRIVPIARPGVILAVCLALTLACRADLPDAKAEPPFLSPIFGDNMVLQRGRPNNIWGWSKPGDRVKVDIESSSATGVAGADGRWMATITVPPMGGPYTVAIHGAKDAVLHNVMVGDVWLCGGQSNMFLGVGAVAGGADEIKRADHPDLRLFIVSQKSAYSPAAIPAGDWKVCSPKTLGEGGASGFSAVAYFFARRVRADVHVPIGLIQDCVGGSTAETWMSPASLTTMGDFKAQLDGIAALRAKGAPEYGSFLMHWLDDYDAGAKGDTWAKTDLDDSKWKDVDVPGAFAELGVDAVPSVCWFRREITLAALPAGDAFIFLGSVEKMDTTYINGTWIGASSWVENPRIYRVPAGVLKAGKNVVAVRVFKWKSADGFTAKPEVLRLQLGDKTSVPLAGKWKAIVSVDARAPHPMPLDFENYATEPTVFYHGMIAPLAPLAITGALWYQGEANSNTTDKAVQYRTLLPKLVADWRSLFNQPDMPFYIVGLPGFMHRRTEAGDDGWAEVREAQALTAAKVPGTGLAVTIDTGDENNIHPREKKIVGERLALCALAGYYHVAVADKGPTFTTSEPVAGGLKLHFTNIAGGLAIHGPHLGEFTVAGADHKWSWAQARIEGDSVIVSSAAVAAPVAARYAWQANPEATLYNNAGLPAVPFRTDDWPFAQDGK
ncbi:MAG TPA: sialate O-acetylesterase [Opitutaceae bacterium]|nr:sialate O-acetylesterase [Opitutaceae bacterium]